MIMRSVPLDQLVVTVVVDNETDTLSSIDPGVPQLPEIVSLLGRIPPTRQHEGHDCIAVFDHLCVACHGLSVLRDRSRRRRNGTPCCSTSDRTATSGSTTPSVSASTCADRGGVPVALALGSQRRPAGGDRGDQRAASRAGLHDPVVVDLHPDRPDQRGIRMPGTGIVMLPPEPTLASMAEAGGLRRAPRRGASPRRWVLPRQRGDRPHDRLRARARRSPLVPTATW